MQIKKGAIGIAGKYKISAYKKAPFLPAFIRKSLWKKGLLEFRKTRETDWIFNLVVTSTNSGLHLIAQNLIGDDTFSIEIDSASIGTGTTPPDVMDTDLEAPVLEGILRAFEELTSNTEVFLQFFIADLELPDDTYTEFGLKCGNQLFTRSMIDPSFTKAPGEDISVDYILELMPIEGS